MVLKRITDNTTIQHLNITACLNEKDEVLFYEVYADNGYVIRTPNFDSIVEDENGNPVLSENGKELIRLAYASAMTEAKTYNWQENPSGYTAEVFREGIFDEVIEADTAATESDYIKALEELGVNFNE